MELGNKLTSLILHKKVNMMLMIIILVPVSFMIFHLIGDHDKSTQFNKVEFDLINKKIREDKSKIEKIDSLIYGISYKIDSINSNISTLERDKTVIKEIYYEKLNNISRFDDDELYRFFTDRYEF
jgi:hypothetical protein